MTKVEIESGLKKLFTGLHSGHIIDNIAVSELPRAGGDRRYYRISDGIGTCIGTYDPDPKEAECFIRLSEDFERVGCPTPCILAHTLDFHLYLQEDLGDFSLFSQIKSDYVEDLVDDTLKRLVELQQTPLSLWRNNVMHEDFCTRHVMWDLNYFKYEFLKPSDLPFDEDSLEDDFERFCDRLVGIPEKFWGFMMRDCQSRNVMLTQDGPKFIDFQGGRRGPVLYDAVSFLWQARADFSMDFRKRMILRYADSYCHGDTALVKEMLSYIKDIVLFRTLQVLGAYGFRGLVQHRSHFILSIPGAVENLRDLAVSGGLEHYPELKRVCNAIIEEKRYSRAELASGLRVEVFSFSYKKGYPEDMSGNGGGFMFDCRALHNPGRYKEYKSLTGRDKAVMEFLEEKGEVQSFLQGAWSLTDPAVERYLSRGFSNLQIGFGCTGGQHRSVYCAEATARHIRTVFPEANVVLIHKEHPE